MKVIALSSHSRSSGLLLIVATPIGNLSDISERALEALQYADLIAAEDTRRIAKLMSHFGIEKPTESFHGDSGAAKLDRIIERLRQGQIVAYVSDAGTPTISDPGAELVRAAAEAGITVCPIPGPSALTTALSASGINADRFLFLGYPPRKAGERAEFFSLVTSQPWTVVLYEAPHRLRPTLEELAQVAEDRYAVAGREITKKFEEFIRGPLGELAKHFAENEPRGEFVIIIEAGGDAPTETAPDEAAIRSTLEQLLQSGMSVKTAAEVVAKLTSISRNAAYKMALNVADKSAEE